MSQRLPADCSYRVPYARKRCWRGENWWITEQAYDARHAYVYLIEVSPRQTLRFSVECLRRDLHWLYPLAGEFCIHGPDGMVALWLVADEHVQVRAEVATYEVTLPGGRHLLFGFVVERGWPSRYLGTALA